MRKDIEGPETESTMPLWEGLEGVVREKAREFIPQILEEEVTELLGREKSERKASRGCGAWLPQRVRQGAAAVDEFGHDHGATPPGTGSGGTLRESGVAAVCETDEGGRGVDTGAVPTRVGRGGFRAGAQGPTR